jgi:Kelch motif/Secretion system C-terminal sorting domain
MYTTKINFATLQPITTRGLQPCRHFNTRNMKPVFYFLLFFLFSCSALSAQAWSLEQLPNDETVFGAGATVVGNKIIIAGGINGDLNSSDRVFIYDTGNNIWSEATLSAPRETITGITVGNKAIFAGGGLWTGEGYEPSRIIDIYDAILDTWTTDSLPAPQLGLAAASVGGKAYFGGGVNENDQEIKTFLMYDPETGEFETDSMPYATSYCAAAVAGNKILFYAQEWCMIYDVQTETWIIHDFDEPRISYGGMTVTPEEVWFVGGLTNQIDIYNIANGTWSTKATIFGHESGLVAYVEGKVLIAGGNSDEMATPFVEIFNTTSDQWEDIQAISTPRQFFLSNPMTAPVVGNKAYFPGGVGDNDWTILSGNLDIYDAISGFHAPFLTNLDISVYPTPFTENLRIRIDFEKPSSGTLDITDLEGCLVFSHTVRDLAVWEYSISASHWPAGAYLLRVSTKEGEATQKILKY